MQDIPKAMKSVYQSLKTIFEDSCCLDSYLNISLRQSLVIVLVGQSLTSQKKKTSQSLLGKVGSSALAASLWEDLLISPAEIDRND